MYLSNQSLLVIVVVGIVAGWLAGKVVEGGGFGLIWDLVVGLIGAFIGDWLLPRLGIQAPELWHWSLVPSLAPSSKACTHKSNWAAALMSVLKRGLSCKPG